MKNKLKNNAKKDALALAIFLSFYLAVFIYFDMGEILGEWLEEYEQYELDEVLITLSMGSIALAWYAYRRWREYSSELKKRLTINQLLNQEIAERKKAEEELVLHRNNLQDMIGEATEELRIRSGDLKKALDKEREYNALQSQFVSMASHEFRTPLAIIDGAAQRLMNQKTVPTSEQILKRATKIRNAVKRMTMLTDSMLSAAQMDEGGIAINIAPCNIAKIVAGVCNLQQEISGEHKISYSQRDLPDTVQADETLLEQVFTNLLSNAVKYAPGEPNIEVTAHLDDEYVAVTVQDSGLGIDPKDQPKIFDRFFRAENSIGIVGTGIGLNLVKTIVELHDGTISVTSEKDKGSTFTVRVPIAGPEQTLKLTSRAA